MKQPLLIAVDGFDATGKTTMIDSLIDSLRGQYKVEARRLIPTMVATYKEFSNGTQDYVKLLPDALRVFSYLVESHVRLSMLTDDVDIVFYDRWIFSSYADFETLDFGDLSAIIYHIICSIQQPDLLVLLRSEFPIVIERLKLDDDWMLLQYSEQILQRMYHSFYTNYESEMQKMNMQVMHIKTDNGVFDSAASIVSIILSMMDQRKRTPY